MSIAHVTATFPPYYTGTGNVCYHNARILAARGHDVHVYTTTWPGTLDDPSGVVIHRLRDLLRLGNAPLLPQLLVLKRHDIIHLHYPFIFGAELIALRSLLGRIPLAVTYHNDLIAPGLRGALFSLYERLVTQHVLRIARRICVVSLDHASTSPAIMSRFRGEMEGPVPLPNGVDTSSFHPSVDGSAIREQLQIPHDAVVAGFVGGLDNAHYFKRVDILLKALATTANDQLYGLVVGDGELLNTYRRLAAALGIENRVRFTGGVPHLELPPYMAAMDVLVLPSDAVESFGLVIIEAMACGRPVVASDLPGVRGLIDADVDGVLVQPGSVPALTRALTHIVSLTGEQRSAMGSAGRTKIENHYSWERIGERIEQLYGDILHGYETVPNAAV